MAFPIQLADPGQYTFDTDNIGRCEILQFSATVFYAVMADFDGGTLTAHKSIDAGQSWTQTATGPAVALDDGTQDPNAWQNLSMVVDTINKKIHTAFWGTDFNLCGVTFNANTETFGAVEDSGFQPEQGNVAQEATPIQACFRPTDGAVYVQYGNSNDPLGTDHQQVKLTKWVPGSGFGATSDFGNTDVANFTSMTGGMCCDAATGDIYAFPWAFKIVVGPDTFNLYCRVIKNNDTIGALQLVATDTVSISNAGPKPEVVSGVILQTYTSNLGVSGIAHVLRALVSDTPTFSDETPALIQSGGVDNTHVQSVCGLNGVHYLAFGYVPGADVDFSYVQSLGIGQPWTDLTAIGSADAGLTSASLLAFGFSVAGFLAFTFVYGPGTYGQGFWPLTVAPPIPAPLTAIPKINPVSVSSLPDPRTHCQRGVRVECITITCRGKKLQMMRGLTNVSTYRR
jgi:hypothetical protein